MFRKILVPFSGPKLTEGVFPLVSQLAKGFGSSVLMLWAMNPRTTGSKHALAVVELEEAARRWSSELGKVEPLISVGSPAPTILRVAQDEECDLIVIPTRGRGGISRGILGSVTDQVVRESPLPVIAVAPEKAEGDPEEDGRLSSIIVPLDGSRFAESVLPYVEKLAQVLGLEVILIRVIAAGGPYGSFWADVPVPETDPTMKESAKEYIEAKTLELRKKGLTVKWELLDGSPAQTTAGLGRRTPHNLIALASRSHGGITRLFEGSVASTAIRSSGDPVLVISPSNTDNTSPTDAEIE